MLNFFIGYIHTYHDKLSILHPVYFLLNIKSKCYQINSTYTTLYYHDHLMVELAGF